MTTPEDSLRSLLTKGPERAHAVKLAQKRLADKDPDAIVDWAVETFGDRLGFTTALGYGGVVLLELLRRRLPEVEAFFIDTRCHFDETIELLRRIEDWSRTTPGGEIRFTVLETDQTDEHIAQLAGTPPWQKDPDLCCRIRKVEPMQRVIHSRDAWLSALRRDQGPSRSALGVVRLDAQGVLRVHPLAGWSNEQCWCFIREHALPYNPLHDCGYPSIGCVHCTVPVHTGEDERTGRWASAPKTECGLHDN